MKILKLAVLIVAFVMASNSFAQKAAPLTPAQEKAQRSLYFYLDKEKFHPEVDASDNSVCFKVNDVLYWVTFSENSPVLYTMQRKGFKVGTGKDDYHKSAAVIAANEVNRKYPGMKISVGDTKVDVVMDTYASDPQDYNKVFKSCLERFKNVDKDFRAAYETAMKDQKADRAKTMKEIKEMIPPSTLRGLIGNVSFRLVDGAGNPLSQYDSPLRTHITHFIQPRIEMNPWNEELKNCKLYFRVVRPDNTPIYLPGKKYTAEVLFDLEKSKKPMLMDMDFFGSEKDGFWKAGEYKFEVLDGLDVIYQTTFNLL